MIMFTFKIFEIPDGKSKKKLLLSKSMLDLGELTLKKGELALEFEKTFQFIRVKMNISADINLICDRSLEAFTFHVNQPYEILFKFDNVVEDEDQFGAIRNIDIQKNEISIEQDVLDTILVHLPTKKLHPRFLDNEGNTIEFKTQFFGDFDKEDTIDPRWATLKSLKK